VGVPQQSARFSVDRSLVRDKARDKWDFILPWSSHKCCAIRGIQLLNPAVVIFVTMFHISYVFHISPLMLCCSVNGTAKHFTAADIKPKRILMKVLFFGVFYLRGI